MTKLYDLCVSTREYSDNNGNKKSVWENIGSVLQNDEGRNFIMLKAHFNPAAITRKEGSECILVSMFAPKEKDSSGYSVDNGNSAYSTSSDNYSYSSDIDSSPAPTAYDPEIPF